MYLPSEIKIKIKKIMCSWIKRAINLAAVSMCSTHVSVLAFEGQFDVIYLNGAADKCASLACKLVSGIMRLFIANHCDLVSQENANNTQ